MDGLLSESPASVRQREALRFDELTAPFSGSLVLFGAGNLGRRTLAGLRKLGIEPMAFSDNNPSIWGKEVEGVPVFSPPDAAARFGQSAAFVMTIWGGRGTDRMSARCAQLTALNCTRVVPFAFLYWKHPEVFLPHYAVDAPHKVLAAADQVRAAFELFDDEASQREFVGQIKWRLQLDFDALPLPVEHEIYFPEDLVKVGPEEVFVDCGAFDGDTVKSFVARHGDAFSRLIAFEPDPANFEKLCACVESLPAAVRDKIACYPYATGTQNGAVRFEATGTAASAVGQGSLEVRCVKLDDFLTDPEPTWIKMDIEGAEVDTLLGAGALIARRSPVLAVCVYHQQDHVWQLPLLMRRLSPEYRLFLRPHVIESWDLLCYGAPNHRLPAALRTPAR